MSYIVAAKKLTTLHIHFKDKNKEKLVMKNVVDFRSCKNDELHIKYVNDPQETTFQEKILNWKELAGVEVKENKEK